MVLLSAVVTSILVASPPLTMGTVFPEWIRYCPMEWPFRFLIGFTAKKTAGGHKSSRKRRGDGRADNKSPTLKRFPVYLHLVRLHDLLNGLADVAQAHIDASELGSQSHTRALII